MIDESRYSEEDFEYYLNLLISTFKIEGKEVGITKLVIDKGFESLSTKQKYVFNNSVISPNSIDECSRCAVDIPWSEMIEATENGGLCNYCEHMEDKMSRE